MVLGKFGESVEIGIPFLKESVLAFLGFFHCVIKECGVAGELHQSVLTVEFCVEGALDHAYGKRGTFQDGAAPFHCCLFKSVEWDYCVYHSHLQGLPGGILFAEEPYLACFLLAYAAGQIGCAESSVETSYLRSGLSEAGVFGSDREVAHHL